MKMNSELEAVMKRRRRRAEGLKSKSPIPKTRGYKLDLEKAKAAKLKAKKQDSMKDQSQSPSLQSVGLPPPPTTTPPPPPPGLPPNSRKLDFHVKPPLSVFDSNLDNIDAISDLHTPTGTNIDNNHDIGSRSNVYFDTEEQGNDLFSRDHGIMESVPSNELSLPSDRQNPPHPSFSRSLDQSEQEEEYSIDLPSLGQPDNDYEPPPIFDLATFARSSSKEEQQDQEGEDEENLKPLRSFPTRPKSIIVLSPLTQFSKKKYILKPLLNPITGNIIICSKNKHIGLYEIDPSTNCTIAYTQILSQQFRQKATTTITGLASVLSLAVGTHRAQGSTRVRLAALVDVYTLALDKKGDPQQQTQQMLVLWQWGYASNHNPVAVQSISDPPNAASYDPASLHLADGICFLSGFVRKTKLPCVHLCKANVGNPLWSSVGVGPSNTTIVATSLFSQTQGPYLAIALSDGSVTIWMVKNTKNKNGLVLSRLCRLEASSALRGLEETKITAGRTPISPDQNPCIHIEWTTFGHPSLLMLAVTYADGLAIFNLASLPSISPEEEIEGSSNLTIIEPFSGARFDSSKVVSASWMDLGPHCNPCLAILVHGGSESMDSRILLGAVDMVCSNNASIDEVNVNIRPLLVVCNTEISLSSPISLAANHAAIPGLLGLNSFPYVVCYSNGKMAAYRLSTLPLDSDDAYTLCLRRPVASAAIGLDSTGTIALQDSNSDDDVLYVFTVTQCKGFKPPVQRHILCRTRPGDSKPYSSRAPANSNDDVNTTGGGFSTVICDLKTNELSAGFQPHRIVRCPFSDFSATIIGPALGNADSVDSEGRITLDPTGFIIVDTGEANSARQSQLKFHSGRDVVFLSKEKEGARALVLSTDGSAIQLLTCKSSLNGDQSWREGPLFRPYRGAISEDDYVDCCRLFCVSSGSRSGLVVAGTRVRDGLTCITTGPLIYPNDSQMDGWSKMLPNVRSDPVLWLKQGEGVSSLCQLPAHEGRPRCIAIATQLRVMIVSDSLKVLAETSVRLSSSLLASVGSHTVSFCTADLNIRYLSCLDGKYSQGLLATLPSAKPGCTSGLLLALRPDRILYSYNSHGVQLLEEVGTRDRFLLPAAITKLALVLEPLVANALCERKIPEETNALLRILVEKFGRKISSLSHTDDEGIGNLGSGLTSKVYDMLSVYGFKEAASWLLTGSTSSNSSSNGKILPPWVSIPSKAKAAVDKDTLLQIIANGDQYFSDYVKSPDQSMVSTLPRKSDPSALFSKDFAREAILRGDIAYALKLLDVVGSESSDCDILQLVLSLQIDPFADITKVLIALSGSSEDENLCKFSCSGSTSSMAALALDLRRRQVHGKVPLENGDCGTMPHSNRWMRQLAPSIQRGYRTQRSRHRLIGENALNQAIVGRNESKEVNRQWSTPVRESKHFWNEGPLREKENLLRLDRVEEWLGRHRPSILGKDGAAAALERGEKTLADILSRASDYDDDSFGGHSDGSQDVREGWVEGIGEGRTDEDNLSAYFRMSEGADEHNSWKIDGLIDLSKFQNKAVIVGSSESSTALQITLSSVDEGEPGKVKSLYDIIFNEAGDGNKGMAIKVLRGGSLDVGILHGTGHDTRKKCSIEFWYQLPELISEDLVLVRRSLKAPEGDISISCGTSDKQNFLWELAVLPSGVLDFRSAGGSSLMSTSCHDVDETTAEVVDDFNDHDESTPENEGRVFFQRQDGSGGWNHVCLVLNSSGLEDLTSCLVSIVMKGALVASETISVMPQGMEDLVSSDISHIDLLMEKTVLVFGASPNPSLRLTEIRVWCCERSVNEIKTMMYEYLQAAETKRKFKVKIRNKREGAKLASSEKKGGILAPPEEGRPGKLSSLQQDRRNLLPPPRVSHKRESSNTLSPSVERALDFDNFFEDFNNLQRNQRTNKTNAAGVQNGKKEKIQTAANNTGAGFFRNIEETGKIIKNASPPVEKVIQVSIEANVGSPRESSPRMSLLEPGVALSKQVRSSAAAALLRGPPATRHFGGNRGGLARDHRRGNFGVGAIAICGAEKTVVYTHDDQPPGKTYPIGASGAVISDEVGTDGSEYLCCFLAKEKRMVVFELSTRTIIVELQMTTKLNFWRYLPPQVHGNSLVFTLITPVGGFHWMPLEESPRPRQVFKRGADLQGKKIITYEEGGSNGLLDTDARSSIALLLASIASSGTPVEAWIMPIGGSSVPLCLSNDVLGAALVRPVKIIDEAFLPVVVTAETAGTDILVSLQTLTTESNSGTIQSGKALTSILLDQSTMQGIEFLSPTLAMGTWPDVICCSHERIIVAAIRRNGLVAVYHFNDDSLELASVHTLDHFIVDASIRSGRVDGTIEIVLLLSDNDSMKDGQVVSIVAKMHDN